MHAPDRAALAALQWYAAAVLLVSGCAAPGFLTPATDLEFEVDGRIAVRYHDDAGTGNVAWRHWAHGDEMLLTSPLGQGLARIVRSEGEIVLTMQDGKRFRSTDAEGITEQVLGFRLPLAGLADWIRARPSPAPSPAVQRRDAHGRLAELQQSGWTVEYQEYVGERPARMRLSYPGVELRLAIASWK